MKKMVGKKGVMFAGVLAIIGVCGIGGTVLAEGIYEPVSVKSYGTYIYDDGNPDNNNGYEYDVLLDASDITKINNNLDVLKTDVDACFQSVSEGKALLASTLTDLGVQTESDATFETINNSINELGGKTITNVVNNIDSIKKYTGTFTAEKDGILVGTMSVQAYAVGTVSNVWGSNSFKETDVTTGVTNTLYTSSVISNAISSPAGSYVKNDKKDISIEIKAGNTYVYSCSGTMQYIQDGVTKTTTGSQFAITNYGQFGGPLDVYAIYFKDE